VLSRAFASFVSSCLARDLARDPDTTTRDEYTTARDPDTTVANPAGVGGVPESRVVVSGSRARSRSRQDATKDAKARESTHHCEPWKR
jgi:hypothetical protein